MHHAKSAGLLMGLILALMLTACAGNTATATPAAPASPATSAPAPTSVPTSVPVAPTATPVPTAVPTATTAPTATPVPPATGNACLVGTWELSDMSQYMQSVMATSGSAVSLVGQSGKITYVFGADGSAKVDAQDFTMKMAMTVEKLTLELDVVMSGGATSTYAATADKVTFSGGELQGLKVSATMNGTEMFKSTPAELAAMFGVSPDPKYSTFGYQCTADKLVYTPPIDNAQPVVMNRVQ